MSHRRYSKGKDKSENGKEKSDFGNYDSRAMEKDIWVLHRLIAHQGLENAEEINAFFNRALASNMVNDFKPETDEERAQLLAYEAFGKKGVERKNMALQALKVSQNCTDAYVILAEMEKDNNRKIELYSKGIEGAEKTLGREIFQTEKGHFWGLIETRPYMRAQDGLAVAFWSSKEFEKAQKIFELLLQLNPSDNQGNRHSLLSLYLYHGEFEKAKNLIGQYDENSTEWNYNRALLLFLTSGISLESKNALIKAFDQNHYVPALLLSDAKHIPVTDYMTPGEPDEAGAYVRVCRPLWLNNMKTAEWLADEFTAYMNNRGKNSGGFFHR